MSHMIVSFFTLALTALPVSQAELPASLELSKIRTITVQHDGRWMPLDTLARDVVEMVTGQEYPEDRDPVLLLLTWTFDPENWKGVPLIPIRNAELRAEIRLPASQTVFSYESLISHKHFHLLVDQLGSIEGGRKPNPLESKVSSIHQKIVALQGVFLAQAMRPIPDPGDALGPWRSVAWFMQSNSEGIEPVRAAWVALREAFLADDAPAFTEASNRLAAGLDRLPAAHRPSAELIALELRYNRMQPFRTAWIIMAAGALLAAVSMLVRRKWFDGLALAAMIGGFGMLSYGLWMRGTIAGRLPAANMFESLVFLSWGMGAFAILAIFFFRHRSVPLTASAMGALALFLADTLPMNHFIHPIAPVLMDTVWMSIHVPVIMVSYSVLALAVLIAHVQVIVMAAARNKEKLVEAIDKVHYWYVNVGALLLFIGITTGSMWAASSWGRYWGWDPKEVWSLIAFLGYMAIIHVRVNTERVPPWAYGAGALLGMAVYALVLPKMAPLSFWTLLAFAAAGGAMIFFVTARGRFATAVKSILAFWMIIMTYVGVNYVLGIGLHSYGFGTGAIASRVFLIGMIDLSLVAICSLFYLIRKYGLTSSPGAETGN